jgi:hypothetical protein
MRRTPLLGIGIALSALVAREAGAQWNVARFDTGRNRVYTTFGLDPALVTSAGYGRVVPLFGHKFLLAGEAGMVVGGLDPRDFRARLGAHTSLVHWRSLHLTGSATFVTRGTDNSIYRAVNFGADLTGTAGLYRRGWFAAGEFGFDKAIVTHLTHSDWYRTYFYPDAKDGWYLDTGGTFHYGLVGGLSVGRAELVGRFGWLRTEGWNDLVPPMYASLGVGFGF